MLQGNPSDKKSLKDRSVSGKRLVVKQKSAAQIMAVSTSGYSGARSATHALSPQPTQKYVGAYDSQNLGKRDQQMA